MEREIFDLLQVMKIDESQRLDKPNMDFLDAGLVLDFDPTETQERILRSLNVPIEVRTFFSREERENADPLELITKQILHYVEIYGFGEPGEFSQLSYEGTILPVKILRGVTEDELHDMLRSMMYKNAPIKDVATFEEIVNGENLVFNVNQIANNELRVRLFAVDKGHWFENGDDAVRWIVYRTTGDTMLIKSKEVVQSVLQNRRAISPAFLEAHAEILSRVFNRHKQIIMSLKYSETRTVINQISRWSKTTHVPVREAINKTYIAKALNNEVSVSVLKKISVRDKLKYLNVLAWKKQQKKVDAFVVRNGKIHLTESRKIFDLSDIERVEQDVLNSLASDLQHLNYKTILLDENVDYGLPTSSKQTVGNLPFGTSVEVGEKKKISSGIFWKNEWGANDLDLSTVDDQGRRVGWGSLAGYGKGSDIVFSGDVTYAPGEGAMEFMTSAKSNYGLFVNVYSGSTPCDMEIVVGTEGKNRWIGNVHVREKYTMKSRGEIVGFVRGKKFIVYAGRMNNKIANFGENPIVQKATVDMWTVSGLLEKLKIPYHVSGDASLAATPNHDLRYENFTFDKLEALFEV